MYLGADKPVRRDSPWRVLVLVLLVIGGLYVVREQFSGARWARPFDATPTPTRNAESHFDEAEALYDEGLLDESIAAYERAYRIDPVDNIALSRLVRLMAFRERTAEVLEQYGGRLLDKEAGDARTLAVLGMVLDWHAMSNAEELLPTYLDLSVVTERDVQAEDWVYSRQDMTAQLVRAAHRACEQAVRLDSDLPEAYACLAEAAADRKRYEEAETAARTAVELNPNVPDTHRALAYVLEAQGEYEQAIEAYQAAILAHPKLSFLHISIGRTYRAVGYRLQLKGNWDDAAPQFEQAVAHFEEAILLDPADPLSFDEIGWTYGHYMGDDREMKQRGVDYLEEALIQNPGYALSHRHLGQVYYDLQNWEEAIPAFERALELGGLPPVDAVWSHILLGWSYYVLDRDEKEPEELCLRALPQFEAAQVILGELPRRELGLEYQAELGLEACD